MRTIIGVALLLFSGAILADGTTHYTVLFQGQTRGEQITTVTADGRVSVSYKYQQNGRGPDLKEQLHFAADDTLLSYQVTGKSTFGAPVDETFTLKRKDAQWHSHSDSGRATVSGPAMYVPVEYSPETRAAIARAVARKSVKRLAALPGGELSVQQLTSTQLTAEGRSIDVALFAINGLSTRPVFVWLTNDSNQQLFASVFPGWFRVVRQGWEPQSAALEALQVKAESGLLQQLSKRVTHRFPGPILLRDVRVFDSQNARLLEPSDVYVAGGRIAAVYENGSTPREAVTTIDGNGRVLMPALFDMHSHEFPWNAVLQVAGGVTSSRDMGGNNQTVAQMSADFDSGQLVGPRVLPAGYIEGDSQFSSPGGFVVKDLQGAKDAVDWYAQHGYRQIKIYNSFRPEWVEPTAAYAHQRGLRVGGHIPAFMRAEEAVRAGYDEIQHINQVLLNFFVGPKDDTRTLQRFYLIAEKTHDLDLDSARVRDFIQLLKEHGTVIDTTLTAFEAMLNQKQGEMNPSFAAIASHVPVSVQREWRTNSMNVTAKNAASYRASWNRLLDFVALMYRAGIPFVAGTDDIAGFTLHRELELYVRVGIPPADALRIATWNAAKVTGTLDRLGSIERGKSADLILVDGDPTQDISDIRRICLVMKEGVVYYPAELYEALGVKKFVDPPRVTPP